MMEGRLSDLGGDGVEIALALKSLSFLARRQ